MSCIHVGHDRPRMIRGQHDAETCPGEGCPSCLPCDRDHCLVGWHGERGECQTHATTVCPSCLAKVREHLTEIVRLSGAPLVEQVMRAGRTDTEAAHLLGPAADPKQWRQRADYGHIYEPEARLGWHEHPEGALGWLDMLVTSHLGHERTGRITVQSAGAYLDRNLHFLAADIEFDFADLAVTLEGCRTHLERVLHDGEQVETGAPCVNCRTRFRKATDDAGEVTYSCRCNEVVSEGQYRLSLKAEYIDRAEMLTVDDMAIRTTVPAGTIRRWASSRNIRGVDYAPLIRSCATNGQGRKVYRVIDIERIRDTGGDSRGAVGSRSQADTVSNEGAA